MNKFYLNILLLTIFMTRLKSEDLNPKTFPEDFLFGVSTAAYQVEGGWNANGKGENIWDHFTHNHPEMIDDSSNGDVACDSYNKIEQDVALLKNLGVNYYRFSLSWSRILPSPLSNKINKDGIKYYNKLINLLHQNNIQPLITLYHWDLPQSLQELGGWTNTLVIEAFVAFANVAFENFGDRVQLWTTFNQPRVFCLYGYGDNILAPAININGIAEYLCGHNVLKAHAEVYHLYNTTFKPTQKGRLSITLDSEWYEPVSDRKEDIEAAERALQFTFGWYANPIFSQIGDYPNIMKESIAKRSKREKFIHTRLPKFTTEEVRRIKDTQDFFSLNHYRTFLAGDKDAELISTPAFTKDMNVDLSINRSWPVTAKPPNKVVPWGFTKLLKWIKTQYGDIEIYITENGYADLGEIDDVGRIEYFALYLKALLDSINKDGVRVKAYTAWSLMDNYEWAAGYTLKFGLYHVDFSSSNRTRKPKSSVEYFKKVISSRSP